MAGESRLHGWSSRRAGDGRSIARHYHVLGKIRHRSGQSGTSARGQPRRGGIARGNLGSRRRAHRHSGHRLDVSPQHGSHAKFPPSVRRGLFLVSADPPITEVEVDFLKEVRAKVVRLFFLVNKVDYLSDEERDEAVGFLRHVLRDEVDIDGEVPIFSVSARMGLKAKQLATLHSGAKRHGGSGEAFDRLPCLGESCHAAEGTHQKNRRNSRRRADARRLTVRSLQMPLGELQDRLSRSSKASPTPSSSGSSLPTSWRATSDVRLHDWKKRRRDFASGRGSDRQGVAQEALATATEKTEEAAAQNALRIAIPVYFEREMGTISSRFTAHMRDVLQPHRHAPGS